jgi:leucyl-tRNA synthetase
VGTLNPVSEIEHVLSWLRHGDQPYIGHGILINSGEFDGLNSQEALPRLTEEYGVTKTQYKLRDWLVSRQRYWGAPIPIIYCDRCGMQPVPEADLPVQLPQDVDFLPTGESPLARSPSFHQVACPKCGSPARRDSDTMDTFVDSSWYYYRYLDSQNAEEFVSKEKIGQWMPIDTYVGGAEHAVLHLLYSRFFTKVLHDLKFVNFEEPFLNLRNQGLILGPDGEKMSKSKGNVINPDDVIAEFGADSLRMYEMFMGPLEDAKPWSTQGLVGIKRFLDRVWVWAQGRIKDAAPPNKEDAGAVDRLLHRLVKKVTEDIESFGFNTAVSAFMQFHNEVKQFPVNREQLTVFLQLLYPFAPHIAEELHEQLGGQESLQLMPWPAYDAAKITDTTAHIMVQVNGKIKDKLVVSAGLREGELKARAMASEKIRVILNGQIPQRVVVVPDRLVNIVL